MPQELNVDPTQLVNTAGMLQQAVVRAINSVTSVAGTAVPVPADATLASIEVAEKFTQYVSNEYLPAAADALAKLSEGVAVFPQLAASFTGTDEAGGAAVLQAAAGGLGPLTGVLGTIPQMAQSMAQEAAVTEEPVVHTSEEDGRESPDPDATFV